jgi:predicted enzyme related to lactoylglutathione lyase
MNTIGYFEIQSSDPAREIRFYELLFGWKFELNPNVPIEYYQIETRTIRGALLKRPAAVPSNNQGTNAFVCSIEVADFDKTAALIKANGGVEAMPKFAIPGTCWQGYFVDADHNTFGIFQVDPNAK